jgi:hypothetical protein
MSTKHTPGPWLYITGDEWSHSVVTEEGELPSGDMGYWTVASINKNREPQHKANARLIAAAPELLEALRTLKMAIVAGPPEYDSADWIEMADAAIAKATGGKA